MKNEIWDILSGESVILCGDGRNDSPRFSAKYCMYAMMEQYLDIIVDVEVVDKRQTGGVSTNMEVFGLKQILERMVGEILISEVEEFKNGQWDEESDPPLFVTQTQVHKTSATEGAGHSLLE